MYNMVNMAKYKHFLSHILVYTLLLPLTIYSATENYKKYSPRIQMEGKIGNRRGIVRPAALIPLYEHSNSIIHLSLIGMSDTRKALEGNFGIGIRHLIRNNIFGLYGFYDIRSSSKNNTIHQTTIGAEWFREFFEFRVNVYLPKKQEFQTSPERKTSHYHKSGSTLDVELLSSKEVEQALPGFDIDIGTQLPRFPDLTIRAAYFRFASSDKYIETRNGVRGVIAYQLFDFLQLDAEVSYDNQRKTVFFGGITVGYNFDKSAKKHIRLTRLEKKMNIIPIRDIDAVMAIGQPGKVVATLKLPNVVKGNKVVFVADLDGGKVTMVEISNGEIIEVRDASFTSEDSKITQKLKKLAGKNISKEKHVLFLFIEGGRIFNLKKFNPNMSISAKDDMVSDEREVRVLGLLNGVSGADIKHPSKIVTDPDKEKALKDLQDAKDRIKALQDAKDKIEGLNKKLKDESKRFKNKSTKKKEQLDKQLQKAKQNCENKKIEYDKSQQQHQSEKNQLTSELKKSEKDYADGQQKVSELERNFKQKKKELQEEVANKEKELEEKIKTAKRETELVQQKLETARKKSVNQVSDLEKDLKNAQEVSSLAQQNLDVARKKHTKEVDKLNEEHTIREQQLQDSLGDSKKVHRKLSQELKKHKQKSALAQQGLEKAQKERDNIQSELKEAKQKAKSVEKDLQEKLRKSATCVDKLTDKISSYDTYVDELEDDLEYTKDDLEDAKNELENAKNDLENTRAFMELEVNNRLEKEIESALEEQKAELEDLTDEINIIDNELQESQKKVIEIVEYAGALENKLENVKETALRKEKDFAKQLKKVNKQHEEAMQSYGDVASDLQLEMQGRKFFESQVTDLQSKISEMELAASGSIDVVEKRKLERDKNEMEEQLLEEQLKVNQSLGREKVLVDKVDRLQNNLSEYKRNYTNLSQKFDTLCDDVEEDVYKMKMKMATLEYNERELTKTVQDYEASLLKEESKGIELSKQYEQLQLENKKLKMKQSNSFSAINFSNNKSKYINKAMNKRKRHSSFSAGDGDAIRRVLGTIKEE